MNLGTRDRAPQGGQSRGRKELDLGWVGQGRGVGGGPE